MPRLLHRSETLQLGRIKRVGAAFALALLIGGCSEGDSAPENLYSEKNLLEELADRKYSVYAEPLATRPEPVGELDKLNNPITPVCVEESATVAVDSMIVRAYVKGLGKPVVGFVADYEFPDIYAASFTTSFPECTDEDSASINVGDGLPN